MNQQDPALHKDLWKVTVTNLDGKNFTYPMETEQDANAFSAAIYFHCPDVREVTVKPA